MSSGSRSSRSSPKVRCERRSASWLAPRNADASTWASCRCYEEDVTADLDLVRRLAAADQGLAIIAVARPDGSVHTSLVNAGPLDDDRFGGAVVGFVVRGDAKKLALMRKRGRCNVVFRAGWEWVAVEGPL